MKGFPFASKCTNPLYDTLVGDVGITPTAPAGRRGGDPVMRSRERDSTYLSQVVDEMEKKKESWLSCRYVVMIKQP